jgi:hypothetical protein
VPYSVDLNVVLLFILASINIFNKLGHSHLPTFSTLIIHTWFNDFILTTLVSIFIVDDTLVILKNEDSISVHKIDGSSRPPNNKLTCEHISY